MGFLCNNWSLSVSFYFHQINIRDIDNEIDLIKKRRSEKNTVVIGLEITHSKIGELLDINIDPQHNGSISDYNKKITCVEKIKELFPKLIKYKYKRIYIYFLKTDLDSISAAVMLDLLFNYQKPFTKNVLMRFNYISESDKHGRAKYNKTKNHNQKIPLLQLLPPLPLQAPLLLLPLLPCPATLLPVVPPP